MTTLANLLVILLFLSGLYTVLGLLCGLLELAEATLVRPYRRRPLEHRSIRRNRPRRRPGSASAALAERRAVLPARYRESRAQRAPTPPRPRGEGRGEGDGHGGSDLHSPGWRCRHGR
jgi:hypothetical protein